METIAFDLDGTLIDSAQDIFVASNKFLRAQRKGERSYEEVRSYIGRGVENLLHKLLGNDVGEPGSAVYKKNLADLRDIYNSETTRSVVYPHVIDALSCLREDGYQMVICTNKPSKAAAATLKRLQLSRYFDAVVGADDTIFPKPHPAHLDTAAKAVGHRIDVFVGDSEIDAEAADRYGVPFVFFADGYCGKPLDRMAIASSFSDYRDLRLAIGALLE